MARDGKIEIARDYERLLPDNPSVPDSGLTEKAIDELSDEDLIHPV